MKCQFKLTLYATGSLTIECSTPFTTEFAVIGSRNIDPNYGGLFNASFTGKTSDGGTVDIKDMAVDDFNLIDHGIPLKDNPESKFVVDLDSLHPNSINFLSQIWQMKGRDPRLCPTKGKRNLEGYMTFLIIREVIIDFKSVNPNDTVTESWGLTNLQFAGCEQGIAGRPYPDSFKINIDKLTFTISHVDDYQQKIRQLRSTAGVDITANIIAEGKYSELPQVESALEKVCYLLTLATMNWVTRLFKDVLKGGEVISTTLLPYFTLPFKKAYNVIDIKDGNNCQLRRFLETTYEKYIALESSFQLRFVIEYYISSARQHSSENQFAIGYLGLDCLASNAPKYAEQLEEKLENKSSVVSKEEIIKEILRNHKQNLSGDVIHELAEAVAYKEVGDKMKIQYLASKFEVEFDKKILDDLISFRGRFMHTGMDQEMEARKHYENVLGILERTLLAMLGWKGQPYRDKLSGYRLKTLN
jgi:hypothetical protein